MIEEKLRPIYQKYIITPLVLRTCLGKLSPHVATGIGCFFGVITAPLLAWHQGVWAVVCLIISGFFDTLDGSLARHQKSSSPWGAVCDIISDRMVEIAVVVGLFCQQSGDRAWSSIGMLSAILLCVTSFLVVGVFTTNHSEKGFHYSFGLMERAEAFCFWIGMIWFPSWYFFLSWIFIGAVLWTACFRVYEFKRAH